MGGGEEGVKATVLGNEFGVLRAENCLGSGVRAVGSALWASMANHLLFPDYGSFDDPGK